MEYEVIDALECTSGCCVGKTQGDRSRGRKPFRQLLLCLESYDGALNYVSDMEEVGEHGEKA